MAYIPEDKEEKLSSMSAAVKIVIDAYPIGHEFYGNQLHDDVTRIYPGAVNMYPDTILKMARRHRRDSYICIDRNNSLYKRVKSKIEIEQEKIERERAEELARIERANQTRKPEQITLFTQGFFAFFFLVVLGAVFALDFFRGRPILESLIASQSASVYIRVMPMDIKGSLPARARRFLIVHSGSFVPFVSIGRSDMILTVNGGLFIPLLYRQTIYINQVKNTKMSNYLDTFLHRRIVKNQIFSKICENSFQKLDRAYGRGYSLNMESVQLLGHFTKPAPGKPEAVMAFIAKGDFYERLSEFSGMA
ncbi:MAG: hypothetical protein FWC03_11790 [Treponema sp.]|nr:hypothetical protein [Treponema sp.]MCL2245125.1 hypothetical protein [Treponema sp.]